MDKKDKAGTIPSRQFLFQKPFVQFEFRNRDEFLASGLAGFSFVGLAEHGAIGKSNIGLTGSLRGADIGRRRFFQQNKTHGTLVVLEARENGGVDPERSFLHPRFVARTSSASARRCERKTPR